MNLSCLIFCNLSVSGIWYEIMPAPININVANPNEKTCVQMSRSPNHQEMKRSPLLFDGRDKPNRKAHRVALHQKVLLKWPKTSLYFRTRLIRLTLQLIKVAMRSMIIPSLKNLNDV